MAIIECPVKAAEFDSKHGLSVINRCKVKNHAGARELANQYTTGKRQSLTLGAALRTLYIL